MKVILTGATGYVGEGLLLAMYKVCAEDYDNHFVEAKEIIKLGKGK